MSNIAAVEAAAMDDRSCVCLLLFYSVLSFVWLGGASLCFMSCLGFFSFEEFHDVLYVKVCMRHLDWASGILSRFPVDNGGYMVSLWRTRLLWVCVLCICTWPPSFHELLHTRK